MRDERSRTREVKKAGENLHFWCDEVVEFDEEQRGNEGDTGKGYCRTRIGRLREIFGDLSINVESRQ